LLIKSILPLAFFAMALICIIKTIHWRRLRAVATKTANGTLKNIAVKNPYSAKSRYYQATLVFTPEQHHELALTLTRHLEAVDFLAKNIGASIEVTVFYDPHNPRRHYVKELALPIWRYYVVAAVLGCCAVCFGWMMFTL